MAWMVWGQGTGVGSGHWLLSGSPGQLFPAMDGGLVPLPGSPRWLLLSSWWQGGSRSRDRHRVLAGMRLQGCRSTPGLQEGIWGKRAPAAAPGQAGHPLRAPGPAGKGQPRVSLGWPKACGWPWSRQCLRPDWGRATRASLMTTSGDFQGRRGINPAPLSQR